MLVIVNRKPYQIFKFNHLFLNQIDVNQIIIKLITMNSSNRTLEQTSSVLVTSNHSFKQSSNRLKVPPILMMKIRQCVTTWRKRAKKSKHRWNVLNEWVETQKNYIKDLQLIINRIQKPMIEKSIITEIQETILFRNLDTIIELSRNIQLVLEELINKKNWRPSIIQISPALLKLHPFLKIYIQYCNNYYKGQNILQAIRNLPDIINIEKSLPMDIDSYLIKPIQRPPKYMLLLKDYKKNLPQNHPDSKNITLTIDKYHQVNEINNNAIAQQSKVAKMVYLQKLYPQSMQSHRQYIRQFDANIYKNPIKVYVLTDLLIVTQIANYKETVYKIIHIDCHSFISQPPNGKYFSNILFICGKYETIHILFDTLKQLKRQSSVIRELIIKLQRKQSDRKRLMVDKKQEYEVIKVPVTLAEKKHKQVKFQSFLRITVDGIQKRPLSSFKSQTYYIIKYTMRKPWQIYKLNYTRYSVIEQIYNHTKKTYPQLVLPDLSPSIFNVNIYNQTKNKSQIIQYRCMAIQELLNRLFRWDKIMSNPIFLLEKLRIDNNIWQFAIKKDYYCKCQLCAKRNNMFNLEYYIPKKRKYFYNKEKLMAEPKNFCMENYANDEMYLNKVQLKQFNTIQKVCYYLNAQDGKTDECRMYYPPPKETIQLKIAFLDLMKENTITIQVGPLSTVGEIMRKIALAINIKFFGDFGLFVKYSGIPKLLDTDERIYDVLNNIKLDQNQKQPQQEGFFSSILLKLDVVKKWGEEIMYGKKSKLVVKKHLFFPKYMESAAYKQDPVRFSLLIQQAFYGVYSQGLILTDKEFITVCAIFICFKSPDKIVHIKRGYFPNETLMRILPPSKRALAQNMKWTQDLIKKIDEFKQYVFCQPSQIFQLQQVLLQVVEEKLSWNAMITNMTNYEPSTLQGAPFNVQLGVSHKHLFVVAQKSDNLLLQIPLQVLDYQVTPFSIFIELNDCKYRFDGKMLYNLKKTIEKYQKFQQKFGEVFSCLNSSLYQSKYLSVKSMRF